MKRALKLMANFLSGHTYVYKGIDKSELQPEHFLYKKTQKLILIRKGIVFQYYTLIILCAFIIFTVGYIVFTLVRNHCN